MKWRARILSIFVKQNDSTIEVTVHHDDSIELIHGRTESWDPEHCQHLLLILIFGLIFIDIGWSIVAWI